MALKEDLIAFCGDIFREHWSHIDGRVVPESKDLPLNNTGKTINAAVLYADLDQSTSLVDTKTKEFSAEVYKAFLRSASRIISANGGAIRSFDGDRVMGIFVGDTKCDDAAKAGLQIKWAMLHAINPAAKAVYADAPTIKHTVGIDVSDLLVVRAGMRNSNDLVWVGKAANHAAKLNTFTPDYATRVTAEVYAQMTNQTRVGGNPSRHMWEKDPDVRYGRSVFRSNWSWSP